MSKQNQRRKNLMDPEKENKMEQMVTGGFDFPVLGSRFIVTFHLWVL